MNLIIQTILDKEILTMIRDSGRRCNCDCINVWYTKNMIEPGDKLTFEYNIYDINNTVNLVGILNFNYCPECGKKIITKGV